MAQAARPGKNPDRSPRMISGQFKVLGNHTVFGNAPGSVATLNLPAGQIEMLLEGGFLAKVEPAVAAPPVPGSPPAPAPVPKVITASDSASASDSN